jgi:hypothetical protein
MARNDVVTPLVYMTDGFTFEWSRGSYIDVIDPDGEAIYAINVKGMDGAFLIENSRRGFARRCNRWIRTGQ